MTDVVVDARQTRRPIRAVTAWDRLKVNRDWLGLWFMLPAAAFLILFLAYFLSRRRHILNDRRTLLQAFIAIAMLGLLVVGGDLGTAMVPVITAVVVLWIAGLEKRYMIRVAALGVVLFCVAVASKGLRVVRVVSFLDPHFTLISKIDTTAPGPAHRGRTGIRGGGEPPPGLGPGWTAQRVRRTLGRGSQT